MHPTDTLQSTLRLDALQAEVDGLTQIQSNFEALSKLSEDAMQLFKSANVKKVWGRRLKDLETLISTNERKLSLLEQLFEELPKKLQSNVGCERLKTAAELERMSQHFEFFETQIKQVCIEQELQSIECFDMADKTSDSIAIKLGTAIDVTMNAFQAKASQVKLMLSQMAREASLHAQRTAESFANYKQTSNVKETQRLNLEEVKHDILLDLQTRFQGKVSTLTDKLAQSSNKISFDYHLKLLDIKGQLTQIEMSPSLNEVSESPSAKLVGLIESAGLHIRMLKNDSIQSINDCQKLAEKLKQQTIGVSAVVAQRNYKNFEVLKSQLDNMRMKNKVDIMTILNELEQAEKLARTLSLFEKQETSLQQISEMKLGLSSIKQALERKHTSVNSVLEEFLSS